MKVSKNAVVAIDYTLKDDKGKVIDSSNGRGPLTYIQGIGALIPGLESALEGKSQGDKLKVSIKADDAYGERNEDLIQYLPKDSFEDAHEVKVGMMFDLETNQGNLQVTVVAIDDQGIKVDGNHPLAGMGLNFEVEVKLVREASAQELQHGHVHTHGDHH